MGRAKEMWFDAYVIEMQRLEDEGLDPDTASDRAAEIALDISRERLIDQADALRKREKESK